MPVLAFENTRRKKSGHTIIGSVAEIRLEHHPARALADLRPDLATVVGALICVGVAGDDW